MEASIYALRKTAKPFVKWVGGKTQLIPQLSSFLPDKFNVYFEPFLGGGALFFHLTPEKAVVNDINHTLMKAYRCIKDDPEEVLRQLDNLQSEYDRLKSEERKSFFYARRKEFNERPAPSLRKVVLLIFLNKTCFNGLYRENSKGLFNVPFGAYKNPKIYDPENIYAVHELLKDVEILNTGYASAVESADVGDFVYFDPPYDPLTETANFTSYSGDDFGKKDQERLRNLFVKLDKRGCKVMLSNSNTPFIQNLYKNYRKEVVMATRSINSNGASRGKIEEIVILNY